MSGRVLIAFLLLACAGGAAVEADPSVRARRGWDYTVEPSADLSTVRVTLCFRRFLPKRLVVTQAGARQAFTYEPAEGGATLRNESSGDGVVVTGLRPGGCVSYDVDVGKLVRSWRGWKASRIGGDLLLQPGLFLLRPALWPDSVYVTARFVCPGGIDVVTPWPRVPGSAEPDHHPLIAHSLMLDGTVAFGRFDVTSITAQGATFDVAVLDRPTRTSTDDITHWLSEAARAVTSLYGRFPVDRTQVLVQPIGPHRSPVAFGQAMRAGGATAIFYVAANADAASLVGEWVGVHEMLHLGMPWTYPDESWYQEGFVTYYQEVMRARAGFLTPTEAWQKLHEGFRRGASSGAGPTLENASREMHRSHAYWRVYWGGAAIALRIDLELRRLWPGRRSLDDVMRFIYQRHATRRVTVHRGLEVLGEVDQWLGRPVCVPIARQGLAATRHPPLTSVYESLGLAVERGSVRLDPAAPRAADALAIMGGPSRNR